ncbi:MAG TPA: 23S rRNA (pseudouridine(1915)-N(3))-methyltransferase RlmH [Bacteroidales bacterium]|jgi:23S rRNA (pseudouridine1915-N3)-methyltransferase|nr:23S rRNA (pseudouridine(1915)-N(3))-methyltransferase RlmH [Bacteroidales bacterium]
MKIVLLQVGKTTEEYLNEGISEYEGRIRKYVRFEILTIPDIKNTRNMSAAEQKSKEGEKILQALKEDDFIVLLDEKGKELSTIEFSNFLGRTMMIQKKRIVFIIGGPWGISDNILRMADFNFSLSRLTFSHQIVRLLFMEQLYRAFTVIKGDPYHHM